MNVLEIINLLKSKKSKMTIWNPIKGKMSIECIDTYSNARCDKIVVSGVCDDVYRLEFDKEGHLIIGYDSDGFISAVSDECMLWPSETDRDWMKFSPINLFEYVTDGKDVYYIFGTENAPRVLHSNGEVHDDYKYCIQYKKAEDYQIKYFLNELIESTKATIYVVRLLKRYGIASMVPKISGNYLTTMIDLSLEAKETGFSCPDSYVIKCPLTDLNELKSYELIKHSFFN